MDGDLQKELVWVLGTLVAFIIFLLVGGINELSFSLINIAPQSLINCLNSIVRYIHRIIPQNNIS